MDLLIYAKYSTEHNQSTIHKILNVYFGFHSEALLWFQLATDKGFKFKTDTTNTNRIINYWILFMFTSSQQMYLSYTFPPLLHLPLWKTPSEKSKWCGKQFTTASFTLVREWQSQCANMRWRAEYKKYFLRKKWHFLHSICHQKNYLLPKVSNIWHNHTYGPWTHPCIFYLLQYHIHTRFLFPSDHCWLQVLHVMVIPHVQKKSTPPHRQINYHHAQNITDAMKNNKGWLIWQIRKFNRPQIYLSGNVWLLHGKHRHICIIKKWQSKKNLW